MSDKPLPPSQKKLRDARLKGEIVKSAEVPQAAAFLGLVAYGWVAASVGTWSIARVFALLDQVTVADLGRERIAWFLTEASRASVGVLAVIALLPAALSLFAGLLQTKWLLSVQALMPKFDRLNPVTNAKNMFTATKVLDTLRRLFKSAVLLWLTVYVIRQLYPVTLHLQTAQPGDVVVLISYGMLQLLSLALAVFVIGAVLDYVLQRSQFMKQQRMSYEDAKREHKETEGDPHVRSQRKAIHRALARQGGNESVKKARVLVTNPTHFAVALQYGNGIGVPVVCAKGTEHMALRMRADARAAGIPIYEDVPLARKLYATIEIDECIGRDLFEPIAQVLAWVEQLEAVQDRPEAAGQSKVTTAQT